MANPPTTGPPDQSQGQGYTLSNDDLNRILAFGLSANQALVDVPVSHATPTASPAGQSIFSQGFWQGLTTDPSGKPVIRGDGGAPTTKPLISLLGDLQGYSPEEIAQLQKKLLAGGFYPSSYYGRSPDPVHFGVLDDGTVKAYTDASMQAARTSGRLTVYDIIDQANQQGYGAAQNQQGAKPPPLTIQLTNPDDLLAVVDNTARKILGRKLDDNELRSFVESFHTMEANAQQAKWQQQYGNEALDPSTLQPRGPGGTVTAPPSADAYALAKLRQENPEDVKNVEMEHGMDVFNSLLRGNA